MTTYHKPVLLKSSVDGLMIRPDGTYVDVTFGGGGHSREILSRLGSGRLIAFDQDADARANAIDDTRFVLVPENFSRLASALESLNACPVDGLLADLGVSSHQFDVAERGFSIRFDAALDMRMDQQQSLTAADVVNNYAEADLIRVFREYGELPQARRMAAEIIRSRTEKPLLTGGALRGVLARFAPRGKENSFYAQVFQAIRIEVNDELRVLKELLLQAAEVIRSGGRLVVISYHSLEDRLVKNFINTGNFEGTQEKDFFGRRTGLVFRPVHRKPIEADADEVSDNPRSRSAKMRIAERV